jgi:hypothetical protein
MADTKLRENMEDRITNVRKDGNNIDPQRGNLTLSERAAIQAIPLRITRPAAIWPNTIEMGTPIAKRYTENAKNLSGFIFFGNFDLG